MSKSRPSHPKPGSSHAKRTLAKDAKRAQAKKGKPAQARPSTQYAATATPADGRSTGKSTSKSSAKQSFANWLTLAQLRYEKCELKEARIAYTMALSQSKKTGDLRVRMEALSGLVRLSAEMLDEDSLQQWDHELDALMASYPKQVPPLAWHCKGAVASHRKQPRLAQRYFHRYLNAVRQDPKGASSTQLMTPEEAVAKGWVMLAITLMQRNRLRRSEWLAHEILRRYEAQSFKGINGVTYLLLGTLAERHRRFDESLRWFQKAHGAFLGEHNWYYHLYVLYGYARLSRHQQQYAQAYWYLDLLDKATQGSEFGLLRREIAGERSRLEQDAVDLLIDSRKGVIKTRENGQISLRKQYVLLHILEALSQAHDPARDELDQGLSKAEIIERVWKEQYRPEAHDNKLYYNINRLRKLIEPDVRKPQYLLNWKEGYRLAPGLRVQFIGARQNGTAAQAQGEAERLIGGEIK